MNMNDDCPETDEEMYAIIDTKKPKVKLVGQDGNAFYIIGACRLAWKKAGKPTAEWVSIQKEMMNGNYDNLLATAMKYFDVY